MDLDPRYLQVFYEVGRARSFSRAAKQLHKTQPTVSYQIHQLEQQLATRLFDRSTKTLARTPAGDRLYDLCERFFTEFARLAGDPAAPEPLRIASSSGFGRYVLFPILAAVLPADQPYSLAFPTAEGVLAALAEGACDLGFVYKPLVSSRLQTREVWREELVAIAPPRTSGLPRSADAFGELPFVTYDESEYVFGRWFEAVFGRQPRSLRATRHFEELEEVVATVAAGGGWSIVPARAASKRTAVLRHPRHRVRNPVYAVTRAGALAHPATERVIAALAAERS